MSRAPSLLLLFIITTLFFAAILTPLSSSATVSKGPISEFTISHPFADYDGQVGTHTLLTRFLIKCPFSKSELGSLDYASYWFSIYEDAKLPEILKMSFVQIPFVSTNRYEKTCEWQKFGRKLGDSSCSGPLSYPATDFVPSMLLLQHKFQIHSELGKKRPVAGKTVGMVGHNFFLKGTTDPILTISIPVHFLGAPHRTAPIVLTDVKSVGTTFAFLLDANNDEMTIVAPEQYPLVPRYSTHNIIRWNAQVEWNTHLGGMNKVWGTEETDGHPYSSHIGQVQPQYLHLKTEGDLFLMHNSTTPFEGSFSCWVNNISVSAIITRRVVKFPLVSMPDMNETDELAESNEAILQLELPPLFWSQLLNSQNLYRFGTFSIHCGPNILLTAPTIHSRYTDETVVPSIIIGFGNVPLPAEMSYAVKLPLTLEPHTRQPQTHLSISPLPMELLSYSLFTKESVIQQPIITIPPTVIAPLGLYHEGDGLSVKLAVILTTVMDLEYFSTKSPCIARKNNNKPYWCPLSFQLILPSNNQFALRPINIGHMFNVYYESMDGKQKYKTTSRWATADKTSLFPLPVELINRFNHHNRFKISIGLHFESLHILRALDTWVLNEIYFRFSPGPTSSPVTIPHQIPIEHWFLDSMGSIGYDINHSPDQTSGNTSLDLPYKKIGLDFVTKSTTIPSFILLNTNTSNEDQHGGEFGPLIDLEIKEVTIHLNGSYEFGLDLPKTMSDSDSYEPNNSQALRVDPKVVILTCHGLPCLATEVLISPRAISFKVKFSPKSSSRLDQSIPLSSDIDFDDNADRNGESEQTTTNNVQNGSSIFTSMAISFAKGVKFVKSTYFPIVNTPPSLSLEGNINDHSNFTSSEENTLELVAHVVLHNTQSPPSQLPTFVNLGLFFDYNTDISHVPSALMMVHEPKSTPLWVLIVIGILSLLALFFSIIAFIICRGIIRDQAEADAESTIGERVEKQVKLLRGHMSNLAGAMEKVIDEYQPPNYTELGINPDGHELPVYDPDLETSDATIVIKEMKPKNDFDSFLEKRGDDDDDDDGGSDDMGMGNSNTNPNSKNDNTTRTVDNDIPNDHLNLKIPAQQPFVSLHQGDPTGNGFDHENHNDELLSYETLFLSTDSVFQPTLSTTEPAPTNLLRSSRSANNNYHHHHYYHSSHHYYHHYYHKENSHWEETQINKFLISAQFHVHPFSLPHKLIHLPSSRKACNISTRTRCACLICQRMDLI